MKNRGDGEVPAPVAWAACVARNARTAEYAAPLSRMTMPMRSPSRSMRVRGSGDSAVRSCWAVSLRSGRRRNGSPSSATSEKPSEMPKRVVYPNRSTLVTAMSGPRADARVIEAAKYPLPSDRRECGMRSCAAALSAVCPIPNSMPWTRRDRMKSHRVSTKK